MPIGFVKFVCPEKSFGFIAYSSSKDEPRFLDRLDLSIYFNVRDIQDELWRGDRVEFEITSDTRTASGQRAANVRKVADEGSHVGVVERVDVKGRYFFIQRSSDGERFFAHQHSVIPDSIGRRNLIPGTPVEFDVVPESTASRKREAAAHNVKSIDPSLANIDPTTYIEQGTVARMFEDDFGYIERPDGDCVAFLLKRVVGDPSKIRVGTVVNYSIVREVCFDKDRHGFGIKVYATDISIVDPKPGSIEELEQYFLNSDAQSDSEPEVQPVSIVPATYRPDERKLTLRQLIAQQQSRRSRAA